MRRSEPFGPIKAETHQVNVQGVEMTNTLRFLLPLVAIAFMGILLPGAACGQCGGRWLTSPEQLPPGINGTVYALVTLPNGDLVAGGSFTEAGGLTTQNIARWNGQNWTPLGAGITGIPSGMSETRVSTLAAMPNGDLIAGGIFTTAGSISAKNIARWDGTTWAPLGSGVGGNVTPASVNSLALMPTGELAVGGNFSLAGNASTSNIAKWNGAVWSRLGLATGTNGAVNSLVVTSSGTLVAGGEFTMVGNVAANRIAVLDGSFWGAMGSGLNATVKSLAVLPNGNIVAGGDFTSAGDVAASRIAVWSSESWSPLGRGLDLSVNCLAVMPNGHLVAGGAFFNRIASWNGSAWIQLGKGLGGGNVESLAVMANGELIAAGYIYSRDIGDVRSIASWDGASWAALGYGIRSSRTIPGTVYALKTLLSGEVIVAGEFSMAGGTQANRVTRWDGSSLTPLGQGCNSTVHTLAAKPNGDLIAGGRFSLAGGSSANRIAMWDNSSWSPLGPLSESGLNSSVFALATRANGDVFAEGSFTANVSGDVSINGIARWNGLSWSPLGSGLTWTTALTPVCDLAVLPNGDVVAAGSFTSAGGVAGTSYIARWDGTSWFPLGTGLDNTVNALAVMPNGDLIAGGLFRKAGGVVVNSVARWNGSVWTPLGLGVTSFVIAAQVDAIAVMPNGDLVVGGQFEKAGGSPAKSIARWNGSSWATLGTGLASDSLVFVNALAVTQSGELIVGGSFTNSGGVIAGNWGRWTDSGIPWVARNPPTTAIESGQTLVLSSACASGYDFAGPVAVEWRRDGVPIVNGPGGASPSGGIVAGAAGSLPTRWTNTSTTLTITNAQPSDAGDYTVTFSNSCGSTTSNIAAVSITVPCPCPADFDASGGTPDTTDIDAFFTAWLLGDPTADADCSGGTPDSTDITAFFTAWLAGGC
jgi:trimeric autotransporter adhesin